MSDQSEEWFDDYAEGADELQIDEYDITATPNDFNVLGSGFKTRWLP